MLNERTKNLIFKAAELNENMDKLMESVKDLNIEVFLAGIESNPSALTPDMIVDFAKHGIDLTELTPVAKAMVPPCFHSVASAEEDTNQHENGADASKHPEVKKVGPEDPTEELTTDKNHFIKKNVNKVQVEDTTTAKVDSSAIKRRHKKYTEQISSEKGGIIFLRCNKNPDIENRVLDRLYDAATDKGIYVEDKIVNELKGMEKLKQLIENGSVKYILINNLNEYSRNSIEQEKLVENAFRNGIHILVGENGFLPIIPPELY